MISIKEIQESDIPINTELCKKGTKTKKIYLKQSDLPNPSLPPFIEEQIFARNDKEQVYFKAIRGGQYFNLYAITKNNNIVIEEKIVKQTFTTGDSEDERMEQIYTCIIETDEPVEILYNTEKYIYCIPYVPKIPTVDKLPTSATLTEAVNKNIEVKNKIDVCKDKLAYILTSKKLHSTKEEKMTELIDKVNGLDEPSPKIYGVRVDESNSNPESCCTYIEDAVGVQVATPTSLGGWKDKWPFNKIRIVGFKNGKVVKAINPNNKTKYVDGSSVPTDVDVMVEIPKIYWDFINTSNGYELRISENKFNETCGCYAHKVDGVEKDYIYVGAYLGSVESARLRSRSGIEPSGNITLTNFRTYAHNVGPGYQQFNWFTLILLQNLYLIAYKNLNSQTALGYGYTESNKNKINTGGTNTKGLVFGENSGKEQMCFLGIEDLWGNLWQLIDGMKLNNYNIMVTSDNKSFNDNASGYENIKENVNRVNGYISKIEHQNKSGFIPLESSGSESTCYCDYGTLIPNRHGRFGSPFNSPNKFAGIFCLSVSVSSEGELFGSRLCYLG